MWARAAAQHDVITREQLLELGFTPHAIKHRMATDRLHPLWRGVYAVGRPGVSRHGLWMGAVLACRGDAALSHLSAAALWGLLPAAGNEIAVSVPLAACRHRTGITIHRRSAWEVTTWRGIPVTTPACTVIDIARLVSRDRLESAINRADLLGIATPETLRAALRPAPGRTGVAALRETLDRRTFTMTRSQLERFFLPIARRAGLPKPLTCVYVNGFEVDFWFPDLGLLVETDGLTYHRTPAQQARDRLRDQVHTAAGLVSLRFTHGQVRYEPEHVERVLAAVAARLRA